MSSSYKGFWLNGSKETGFTASEQRGDATVPHQPTQAAIKRAIVAHKIKHCSSAQKLCYNKHIAN
jgi:hypothetical protein